MPAEQRKAAEAEAKRLMEAEQEDAAIFFVVLKQGLLCRTTERTVFEVDATRKQRRAERPHCSAARTGKPPGALRKTVGLGALRLDL